MTFVDVAKAHTQINAEQLVILGEAFRITAIAIAIDNEH